MWFCSSLVWTAAQNSPFSVSPSSCDLAPLKPTSFTVTYDPKQLNTFHGVQLEGFAYYKVMLMDNLQSKFHLIKQWCLLFLNQCLKNDVHLKFFGVIFSSISCLCWEAKQCHSKNFAATPSLPLWMLQDNHHIEGRLLCPPWCVTVRVIGHSFQPGKEHFIPCCSLTPPRVVRHKHESEHKCYSITFSLFLCIYLSPLVCPSSIVLTFFQ